MAAQAGARCGTHVEVAAVDVCQRCGRFLCGECVELVKDDAYCAQCAARASVPASRLAKAALTVAVGAWASIALAVVLPRIPGLTLLLALLPLPLALASLVISIVEGRRISAGSSSPRGRVWLIMATLVAGALLLIAALFVVVYAVLGAQSV